MSHTWIDVRRKARDFHALALAKAKDDRRAETLVAAALELDDLALSMFDRGIAYGPEVLGALDRINGTLKVMRGLDKSKECVVIAHEIGHFKLHRDPTAEVTMIPHGLGGDPLETGEAKVEGYSPRERQEVQADIFASELNQELTAGFSAKVLTGLCRNPYPAAVLGGYRTTDRRRRARSRTGGS
jgi:hypothetical protein